MVRALLALLLCVTPALAGEGEERTLATMECSQTHCLMSIEDMARILAHIQALEQRCGGARI
jgi:hypothetical protein